VVSEASISVTRDRAVWVDGHFHFHLIVLDGVIAEEADGSVRFHEATDLTAEQVEALTETLQRRILRLFHPMMPGLSTTSHGQRLTATPPSSYPRSNFWSELPDAAIPSPNAASGPTGTAMGSAGSTPARYTWATLLAPNLRGLPAALPQVRRRDEDPRVPHRSLHRPAHPPPSGHLAPTASRRACPRASSARSRVRSEPRVRS
jgi:hypothetical protein